MTVISLKFGNDIIMKQRYINKSVVGKTKFEAKYDREKCRKSIFDFKIFLKNRTSAISISLRKTSIE